MEEVVFYNILCFILRAFVDLGPLLSWGNAPFLGEPA
jgi:hypothetical protein